MTELNLTPEQLRRFAEREQSGSSGEAPTFQGRGQQQQGQPAITGEQAQRFASRGERLVPEQERPTIEQAQRFASRGERLVPEQERPTIEGFETINPRSDTSLTQNVVADFQDQWDGIKMLGSYVWQNGPSALADVAQQLPEAFVQSYTRWFEAADEDRFLEMAHRNPVQFVQDWTLPLSLVFSGGTAAASKAFGASAATTRALNTLTRASQTLEIASDPIFGAASVAGQRAVGEALQRTLNRPRVNPPKQQMPIEVGEDIARAPVAEHMKDGWKKFEVTIVDENYPLRNFAQGATGTSTSALENKVRTFAGFDRKAQSALDNGFFDPDDITQPLTRDGGVPGHAPESRKGLTKIIEDTGAMYAPALRDYSVARRALYDLHHKGKTSGVDADQARAVVNQHDPQLNPNADPHVHERWRELRQFMEDNLTYYRQGGLIDKATETQWNLENPNYTPYERTNKVRVNLNPDQKAELGIDDDFVELRVGPDDEIAEVTGAGGRSIRNPKQIIKKFKGSVRMIRDPIETSYVLTSRMMREVELNNVAREIAQWADEEGSGVRWVDDIEGVNKQVTLDELQAAFSTENLLADIAEGRDPLAHGTSPISTPKGLPDNVITVFEDGQRRFLQVDDPMVAEAFGRMRFRPEGTADRWFKSTFVAPFRGLAKMMRAGVTLTPSFTFGMNLFRDMASASVMSRYGFKPGYDNARGAFHFINRSNVFDLWARSGGMQAQLSAMDRQVLGERLQSMMADTGRMTQLRDKFITPLRMLQHFQEFSEATTRLGEFNRGLERTFRPQRGEGLPQAMQRARENGMDVDAAVRDVAVSSRDVSTDFGIRPDGEFMRLWNGTTPFQNAGIQSLDLVRRRFTDPKTRRRAMMRAMMYLTLPSVSLTLHNLQDPEYADIPDVEKDLFWHVRPGALPGMENLKGTTFGDTLWRVPKPFEVGYVFGSAPQRAIESYVKHDPGALTRMLRDQTSLTDSMLQPFAVPTGLKIPLELMSDYNFFFDAPLEPEGTKRLPTSKRSMSSTSEFAKFASELSRYAAELNPVRDRDMPVQAPFSPIKFDHVLNQTLGTLGREATEFGIDPVIRQFREAPVEPEERGFGMPLLDRFVGNPSKRSQARTDFFETMESLQQVANAPVSRDFQGNREQWVQDHKFELQWAPRFRSVADRAFRGFKAIDAIEIAPNMTPKEKRQKIDRIDQAINRHLRQVLEKYREANRKRGE